MTAHTVERPNSTRYGVAKEKNLEAARQLSHIMEPKRRVSQTIEMEMRWSSQPIFRISRVFVYIRRTTNTKASIVSSHMMPMIS